MMLMSKVELGLKAKIQKLQKDAEKSDLIDLTLDRMQGKMLADMNLPSPGEYASEDDEQDKQSVKSILKKPVSGTTKQMIKQA